MTGHSDDFFSCHYDSYITVWTMTGNWRKLQNMKARRMSHNSKMNTPDSSQINKCSPVSIEYV